MAGYWMWYYGDYEIYHIMKVNSRREERDYARPAFWKQHVPYVSVKFRKIFKTITTDNGAEFRNWKLIEKSYTGSNIARTSQYYADAYCSWQRGTNENINKMIRRFFCLFLFFMI